MRADKAKARNEAKMEKMKDHNAKLKKELMSEKEKCEKMTNEISELKNCLIKSAKVAFFRATQTFCKDCVNSISDIDKRCFASKRRYIKK